MPQIGTWVLGVDTLSTGTFGPLPCGMYFGTAEHMRWVAAPDVDLSMPSSGWFASGTYLNGGAYARRSASSHRTYSMSWTLKRAEELRAISDFDMGMYGQGPFYFLLPGTYDNVLPPMWSIPRLAAEDGLSLISNQKPRLMPNGNSSNGYPTASAHYLLGDDPTEDTIRRQVTVPVPADSILHLGAHGQFSGTARITAELTSGEKLDLPALSPNTAQLSNTYVYGPTLVTLRLEGVGTATINSMTAALRTSVYDVPWGTFVAGQGHSGVQFGEGRFEMTMYSAVKNMWHGAAEFIEVGAWQ